MECLPLNRADSATEADSFCVASDSRRPAYIFGPVIDKASEVEIRFVGGQTVRVPTFRAPPPLEHIRGRRVGRQRKCRRVPCALEGEGGHFPALGVPLGFEYLLHRGDVEVDRPLA
jgi:hypothetical protein